MPTRSSDNLDTQQENTKEVSLSSDKKKRKSKDKRIPRAQITKAAPVEATETVQPEETKTIEVEATETVTKTDQVEDFSTIGYERLIEAGRERIDAIDDQILELVASRIGLAGTLLREKHKRRINTRDKVRQEQIMTRLSAAAVEFASTGVYLNKHQIRELYEMLIRLGIENFHKNIIDRRRR